MGFKDWFKRGQKMAAENKDAAWEVMKFMSSDDFQTKYAELLGMFPSRTEPQRAIAEKDPNYESWYDAIQQGRTYAPIAQWAQIENAYKARFGNILDAAGGLGGTGEAAGIDRGKPDGAAGGVTTISGRTANHR